MGKFLLALFSVAFLTQSLGAATTARSTAETDAFDPRSAVGNILLAGLGGGVIGLSTLSFYKEPQDHINNIPIAAGLGVIVTALILTVRLSQAPLDKDPKALEFSPYLTNPSYGYNYGVHLEKHF